MFPTVAVPSSMDRLEQNLMDAWWSSVAVVKGKFGMVLHLHKYADCLVELHAGKYNKS